jgi:hypothetical protein
MRHWLFLLLLLVALPAQAQTFFNPGRVAFSTLGTPPNGAQVYCTDCTEGSDPCTGSGTGAMALRVNGVWKCLDGGGGATVAPLVAVPSCMNISGAVGTLYMADGSCLDATEARIEQKVHQAVTFTRLQCLTSVDIGGAQTITVTGRTGTCGALSDSGTFACTLTGGSGRAVCQDTDSLAVGAGACWALKLVATSGVADGTVSCTLERSS